jgi:hypothetical protein
MTGSDIAHPPIASREDWLAARRQQDWEDSPPGWPQRPTDG